MARKYTALSVSAAALAATLVGGAGLAARFNPTQVAQEILIPPQEIAKMTPGQFHNFTVKATVADGRYDGHPTAENATYSRDIKSNIQTGVCTRLMADDGRIFYAMGGQHFPGNVPVDRNGQLRVSTNVAGHALTIRTRDDGKGHISREDIVLRAPCGPSLQGKTL